MILQKLNPAVDKKWLILIAGLMWCGVGIMLISFAFSWLAHYNGRAAALFYAAGIGAGIPIHFYGFKKLAEKNINRLMAQDGKRCVFSFITWKSYLIIVIMVTLGITLRHSRIPKHHLSIIYNGIGIGLLFSGIMYVLNSGKLFLQNYD